MSLRLDQAARSLFLTEFIRAFFLSMRYFFAPKATINCQIIAAPTLIKKLPLPLRKFIGDMSDTERILVGLDLRRKRQIREKG